MVRGFTPPGFLAGGGRAGAGLKSWFSVRGPAGGERGK